MDEQITLDDLQLIAKALPAYNHKLQETESVSGQMRVADLMMKVMTLVNERTDNPGQGF